MDTHRIRYAMKVMVSCVVYAACLADIAVI